MASTARQKKSRLRLAAAAVDQQSEDKTVASTLKLSAKLKNGVVDVKSLILHPMETGSRVDPDSGNKIPAHHITQLIFTHKDKQVMVANFSTAVSKNPYFGFSFEGANKGDTILARWVDNNGQSDELETQIA